MVVYGAWAGIEGMYGDPSSADFGVRNLGISHLSHSQIALCLDALGAHNPKYGVQMPTPASELRRSLHLYLLLVFAIGTVRCRARRTSTMWHPLEGFFSQSSWESCMGYRGRRACIVAINSLSIDTLGMRRRYSVPCSVLLSHQLYTSCLIC